MSTVRSINKRYRIFVPGGRCGAYALRRAEAKLGSSLLASIKVASAALSEVERLKRHRRRLARHVLDLRDRLTLATGIIASHERCIAQIQCHGGDEKIALLRQAEELEHLRAERTELTTQLHEYHVSAAAEIESVRAEAWQLTKMLRDANREVGRLRDVEALIHG